MEKTEQFTCQRGAKSSTQIMFEVDLRVKFTMYELIVELGLEAQVKSNDRLIFPIDFRNISGLRDCRTRVDFATKPSMVVILRKCAPMMKRARQTWK